MKTKLPLIFFIASFSICAISLHAQDTTAIKMPVNTIDTSNKLLTIVYDIQVKKDKEKTGIEETYNGGIKTVFISNEKARVRLVSLMRIQSIFFSPANTAHQVSVIKESGKKKYKYYLTNEDWDLYNDKYNNDSCLLTTDSTIILNYACRKAIIILKDGRQLSVYYTNKIKPVSAKIEPAFSCIPGLVLQYEYDYKKGSIIYTANKISQSSIDPGIFKIPAKGYSIRKYCIKCNYKDNNIADN